MTNLPPPAEELRLLDAELRQLDLRRAVLLRRREWLIHTLRAAAGGQSAPAAGTTPGGGPPSTGASGLARRPEATGPGVQNLLLALGGVLLTIAAIAFTLVSWSHMGIAGRAPALGALTLAALGAPVVLLRRGLRSTAEAVAALGTALTVLDAYALHEVAFADADGVGYTAAASAVLASVWAAYGVAAGSSVSPSAEVRAAEGGRGAEGARLGLRHPLPLAVATAHLPLLLWALAAGAGPHTVTTVVLATAAGGTAVALRAGSVPVRVVAVVGALGTGVAGVLSAGWLCWSASDPGTAARAAALLVVAAAVALVAGRSVPNAEAAMGAASAAGLCLVAGTGGVLRVLVPDEWTVPGFLAFAIALLAADRTPLPRPLRQGLVRASAAVQCLAVLWTVPLVAGTVLGPVAQGARPWSGAPGDFRDAVFTTDVLRPPYASTGPLVLAVVAAVVLVAGRNTVHRAAAGVAALVLGWAAVVAVPVVLQLPYATGLVAQGVVVVAALSIAERTGRAGDRPSPVTRTALVLALVTSVDLAFLALASESATIGVLASLTFLFGAACRRRGPAPFTAPAALGHATALACAVGASAGWQPHHTALLVLVVPAVAAVVASRTSGSRATVPVEAAGAAAGLLALALAVTEPPTLAVVLSLSGVLAAATALRPGRRAAGHAAAALFLLAAWVRLTAWGVTTPEAYTLPVTGPALVVGFLRRRRDAAVSSWTAYGGGLALTLVPSLLAAWDDRHWLRPLLLGVAALAVTLAGARYRLQAPLVLGAGVLALVTLHELAPYLTQAVGALPRWAPPALAGLVLLALGATYEQRLRDARRLREALGRLR
ncbi:SCO7613 C-terminal domain-containing membrane protein [Streptomyces sp. NPDC093065]|uniref:SCO7613 C-terminal domain-containing membrane protein n=1 Tax=Streptomyces sp. NPDC093065 TaxID=3366021 RepID=UPI003816D506